MSLTPRLDRLDKNYIINGAMDFWQRATSMTTTDSTYVADRFVPSNFGGQVTTTSRSSDVPSTSNVRQSYQVQVGTANASPSSGHHLTIRHHIEGNDFAQLKGKTFTLGFWVKSSKIGIYSVVFGNSAQDRVLVKEYTINVADTWEYKTITVLHDASGTWLYDTGKGLSVTFALMVGSAYKVSPNAWQGTGALGSVNQVNFADTVSNIFRMTALSLVEGENALDSNEFSRAGNSYAGELQLCQRYYQKTYREADIPGSAGAADGIVTGYAVVTGALTANLSYVYPTPMRGVPLATIYNSSTGALNTWRDTGGADITIGIQSTGVKSLWAINTSSMNQARYAAGHLTLDAEL